MLTQGRNPGNPTGPFNMPPAHQCCWAPMPDVNPLLSSTRKVRTLCEGTSCHLASNEDIRRFRVESLRSDDRTHRLLPLINVLDLHSQDIVSEDVSPPG